MSLSGLVNKWLVNYVKKKETTNNALLSAHVSPILNVYFHVVLGMIAMTNPQMLLRKKATKILSLKLLRLTLLQYLLHLVRVV